MHSTCFKPAPYLWILCLSVLCVTPALASSAFIVLERISQPTLVMTEISSDEAYEPTFLKHLWAYDTQSHPTTITHHADARHITLDVPTHTAAIIVQADFGFHARRPHDTTWSWQRKTTLSGATIGLHALKESVNLQASAAANLHPHGLALEILPLEDPFTHKRGDHLPIQVLLNGHPLPNVCVHENFLNTLSELTPPTDNQGKTYATLHADQLDVLQITYESPVTNDPDVDFMRYNSALTLHYSPYEP
nr:DUF4198 domain-containing protein [uncultured Neokomagataea sp.]